MHEGELVGGRFEILRLVGQGRMGSVHEAFDRETAARVALERLIHHRDERSPDLRGRPIAASLAHEDIVRHVAHGTASDGTPYLATEWVEGEDLAVLLARGALGVAETLTLARGIATGLAAAHARAIIHRDVKAVSDKPTATRALLTRGVSVVCLLRGSVSWCGAPLCSRRAHCNSSQSGGDVSRETTRVG